MFLSDTIVVIRKSEQTTYVEMAGSTEAYYCMEAVQLKTSPDFLKRNINLSIAKDMNIRNLIHAHTTDMSDYCHLPYIREQSKL